MQFIAMKNCNRLTALIFYECHQLTVLFSPHSTGLVPMQLAPHQSDHSLLDEDDHVLAHSRPQEAEERLNALPPSHAPHLSDRNDFFFPFRLCFDPETFILPFSNKVLGFKTQSE